MKDYVNVTKPSQTKFWLIRHSADIRVIGFIIAIAFIGSINI